MKKIISIFLVLILLSGVGIAETLDEKISTMTLEELSSLYLKIETEIANKTQGMTRLLPEGIYIEGKNIIAGNYSIISTGETISVEMYKHENDMDGSQNYYLHNLVFENETMNIIVEEGAAFIISGVGLIKKLGNTMLFGEDE